MRQSRKRRKEYEELTAVALKGLWGVGEGSVPTLPSDSPPVPLNDPVNHPSHYISDSGLEVVEVIEAFASANPHRSHAIKYLLRAGRKGGKARAQEDLQKARWWVNRELDLAERKLKQMEKGEEA